MINLPAVCDNCGTIFGSGIVIDNSSVSIMSCTAGPCPNCGGSGPVVDGSFEIRGDQINITNAPPKTIAVFNVIKSALIEIQSGGDVGAAIEKISQVNPEAGTEAATLYSRGGLPALLVFIFMLLSQCSSSQGTLREANIFVDNVITKTTGLAPYPNLTPLTAPQQSEPASRGQSSQPEERQGRSKSQLPPPEPQTKTPSAPNQNEASSSPGIANKAKKSRHRTMKNKARQDRRLEMKGVLKRPQNRECNG